MDLALCEEGDPDDLPGDWQAEQKLDGIRAYSQDGRLLNRRGRDITRKFPEIDVPRGVVDGEIVVPGYDFDAVNARAQLENNFQIEVRARTMPAEFVAFDVLEFEGECLRDESLDERGGRLHVATKGAANVVPIEPYSKPAALWELALERDWEGIVVKDPTAPYPDGRSDRWLKVKTWSEETFPIVGHQTTDNDGFVVLVDVGADEPQKVVANGQADQGAVLDGADRAEVQYLERSKNRRLRKPSLKGVA